MFAVVMVIGDLGWAGWTETLADGSQPTRTAMLWAAGGALLWTIIFFLFERPVGVYVIGHELTHVLFAVLQGIRVLRMELHAGGGRVELGRINWLVALSPYFFPIYTMVVLLIHVILSQFIDIAGLTNFWMGLIGVTWAFHITFTVDTLTIEQSDIEHEGILFSVSIILLFNLLVILIWLIALIEPDWNWLFERVVLYLNGWIEKVQEMLGV